MSGIRFCLLSAVCLCLAFACQSLSANLKVPDEQTAIALAKKRCVYDRQMSPYDKWHAALHQGVWHVWLSIEPGRQDEPTFHGDPPVGFLDIRIRADDGTDSGCVMIS